MIKTIKSDLHRYGYGSFFKTMIKDVGFRYSFFWRIANYQHKNNKKIRLIFAKIILKMVNRHSSEIPTETEIGEGLYFGHFGGITINPKSVIGKNVNINKGATIGQENRGKRKGVPTIGNNVYVGINSVIIGNIHIGDNVLIAANAFVNFDVPANSIVIGNPGKIKHSLDATDTYVCNKI